jgi:protein-L-isoaspartate(D-aspartate) O-methyltransferase
MRAVRVVVLPLALLACKRAPSGPGAEVEVTSAPRLEQATLMREDSDAARLRRDELVHEMAESGFVRSPRVLDAMKRVPRHLFIDGASLDAAYADAPQPIGFGERLEQPTTLGAMTEALSLTGNERVLEIGTGSGYEAAILSLLSREVYSIENVPELGERAATRLRGLGYANVQVRIGDGYAGWPEEAPFDRIMLTAALREIPQALADQLAEGGVIVAPVGEQNQWLYRIQKKNGKLERQRLDAVRFVPLTH